MTEESQALWPDDVFVGDADGPIFEMRSGRRYVLARSLLVTRPDVVNEGRIAMTRHVLDHPPGPLPVVFATHNIDRILSRSAIPMREKARRLMREIVDECQWRPGRLEWVLSPHDCDFLDRLRRVGIGYDNEIIAILRYLQQTNLIELQINSSHTRIGLPVSGLIAFEEENKRSDSSMCFVAMWFNPVMSDIYETGIAPAIEAAGYVPYRVDRHEHNNRIDDEILAGIRRCQFMVADFTQGEDGPRGGVYYEAGFASGLGKQVIHTVRRDQIELVHFDTSHVNHILWDKAEDLHASLANRIGATVGSRAG